jgi:hypothetical protein
VRRPDLALVTLGVLRAALVGQAQLAGTKHRIGDLSALSAVTGASLQQELGWVEGGNLHIEWRGAEGLSPSIVTRADRVLQ